MSNTPQHVSSSATDEVFTLEKRDDGIVILRFAVPGARQNTITADFADSFERALDAIEHDTEVIGVVLISDILRKEIERQLPRQWDMINYEIAYEQP